MGFGLPVSGAWRFLSSPASIHKQPVAEILPNARIADLGQLLSGQGYQVFLQVRQLSLPTAIAVRNCHVHCQLPPASAIEQGF